MKKSRKKGNTGKRYAPALRKKIIAFAEKRGRGGISAAIRKFGVSYIALRRWMKNGPEGAGKRGRGKAAKAPAGLDGRKKRGVKKAVAALKSMGRQLGKLQLLLKQLSK